MDNRDFQQSAITESVAMDSRKFLSAINNSAQSQIKFFQEAVQKLGSRVDSDWNLVALHSDKLFFEDQDGRFYVASHSKEKGGRIEINDIKQVVVTEGDKAPVFESACNQLVDAIEEGNTKKIDAAFSKIAANRFRPTAVPNSGYVKTKDDIVRHVAIHNPAVEEEGKVFDLADRIVESIDDKYNIIEGSVSGSFRSSDFELPITELTVRRVVANSMKSVAENAYKNENFQKLVESTAGLICKGNVEKAVAQAAVFLKENQEFSLLSSSETRELVNNTLAACGVMNESLVDDTTTLFRKTNLKVNRGDIVEAWKRTAKRASHAVMYENVLALEEADDFNKTYDKFLGTIFESADRAKAVKWALGKIKNEVAGDETLTAEIEEMIENVDTGSAQAVSNAESLLARISEGLNDASTDIDNYDDLGGEMGMEPEDEFAEPEPEPEAEPETGDKSGTTINIYTGDNGAEVKDDGSEPDLGLDDEGEDVGDIGEEGEELDLDDLLASESKDDGDTIDEDSAAQKALLDAIENGLNISEDLSEGLDEDEEVEPYALPEGLESGEINHDYGSPALVEADERDIANAKRVLSRVGGGERDDMMKVEFEARQMADEQDMNRDETNEFVESVLAGWSDARRDDIEESQYKQPSKLYTPRRGMKRAAMREGVKWLDREGTGVLGEYGDVRFVLDHADPPVFLSEDGQIEIGIPEQYVEDVLKLAEIKEGDPADEAAFLEWFNENVEQLRLSESSDDDALDESVARMKVDSAGNAEVEVDTDGGAIPEMPMEPTEPEMLPIEEPMADYDDVDDYTDVDVDTDDAAAVGVMADYDEVEGENDIEPQEVEMTNYAGDYDEEEYDEEEAGMETHKDMPDEMEEVDAGDGDEEAEMKSELPDFIKKKKEESKDKGDEDEDPHAAALGRKNGDKDDKEGDDD